MFQTDADRLSHWSRGIRAALRPNVRFSDALADAELASDPELCMAAHLACFTFDGTHLPRARAHALAVGATGIVAETDRLADLYAPVSFEADSRAHVEGAFRKFATDEGIWLLRTIQEGREGPEARPWIFLGVGRDGVATVWKEIDERAFDASRWRQRLPAEDELFRLADGVPGMVRTYGVDAIGNVRFLRRAMAYGQTLLDFVRDGRRLGEDGARQLVGDLAETLAGLHARGIVTGDLRPQNVLVGADGRPTLFDLGLGYLLGDGPLADHDAFVADARYLAPEMVWRHRLGRHTEVFQLGMLYHQLRYGSMPFGGELFPETRDAFEDRVLRFGLRSALVPYGGDDPLLRRMLDANPARRPDMREVANDLSGRVRVRFPHPPRAEGPPSRDRDRVLIPARMGLPHRGHVELVARAIDLGYHAVVSLQRAYTITDADPYPKWDVAKMLARSLVALGYVPGRDFSVTLTRFFATDAEHRGHFALMPGAERVTAIVSGNPGAHRLMARPVIDQRVLFGTEGKPYEPRSWGERLRRYVRENTREEFDEIAADGVCELMPFAALRETYGTHPVEFVPGVERFVLIRATDTQELARGRIRRYGTPDEHVVARLRDLGRVADIVDPLARHTIIRVDGVTGMLVYGSGVLQPDGDLHIPIVFHPNP